jgi:hypothetical protein
LCYWLFHSPEIEFRLSTLDLFLMVWFVPLRCTDFPWSLSLIVQRVTLIGMVDSLPSFPPSACRDRRIQVTTQPYLAAAFPVREGGKRGC